jgi:hypothetical protein
VPFRLEEHLLCNMLLTVNALMYVPHYFKEESFRVKYKISGVLILHFTWCEVKRRKGREVGGNEGSEKRIQWPLASFLEFHAPNHQLTSKISKVLCRFSPPLVSRQPIT